MVSRPKDLLLARVYRKEAQAQVRTRRAGDAGFLFFSSVFFKFSVFRVESFPSLLDGGALVVFWQVQRSHKSIGRRFFCLQFCTTGTPFNPMWAPLDAFQLTSYVHNNGRCSELRCNSSATSDVRVWCDCGGLVYMCA